MQPNDTILIPNGDTVVRTVTSEGDTVFTDKKGNMVEVEFEDIEQGIVIDYGNLKNKLKEKFKQKINKLKNLNKDSQQEVVDRRDTQYLRYPFSDEDGNPYNSNKKSPVYMQNPNNVQYHLDYNPVTKEYDYNSKVGKSTYRNPHSLSFDEYKNYKFEEAQKAHWRDRWKAENSGHGNELFSLIPKLKVPIEGFDKLFGSNTIDIKPQGSAELIFGVNINKVENPTLPLRLQRSTTFDFDEKIQMGVTGKIGDKMELGINYNTKAIFDFENRTKLAYKGKEDEIIKRIEAGDVALPLSGTLIQGSQSLFGILTELQFGKLTVTSVISQQKGQSQEINLKGGAQVTDYEIEAGKYEANKHFFLAPYFANNYDRFLTDLPIITSGISITRIEVWVTNRTGNFEGSRNVVAFMDLGDPKDAERKNPRPTFIRDNAGSVYPDNRSNNLFSQLNSSYSGIRSLSNVTSTLEPLRDPYNFVGGKDYEKVENARLLQEGREFLLNAQLGYISLNQSLNADEVLAVAFEYTAGGMVHRVGEFSNGGIVAPNTLITKLLKGTSFSPAMPTWKLMMKNVYSIGAYQVDSENFMLNVMYQNDKTGTSVNYIAEGPKPPDGINGQLLLKVFRMDQLNSQNDPYPDGMFDFIPGVTVNTVGGRIIFPVREPFGKYLHDKIVGKNPNDPALNRISEKYVFRELYDSIQSRALQIAEKNKFLIKGTYQSSSGNEILLNATSIPQGSVKVSANGALLVEGQDYTVDYNMGRVTIINQGLLESGTPIKVSLESQSLFSIQTKTLFGTHLDYKISDNFRLGGTLLRLSEKPLTYKVGVGEEAIKNIMWGIDGSYTREAPRLTKLIDWLPLLQTKEKSMLTFDAEFAQLIPGHSRALQKKGVSYIDDFEASKMEIDVKSRESWVLASTPITQSEAKLINNRLYGANRAKLSWYNVSSDLVRKNTYTPKHLTEKDQNSHYVREIDETEIFKNRQPQNNISQRLSVLNIDFYPTEKGPYNFDLTPSVFSKGLD